MRKPVRRLMLQEVYDFVTRSNGGNEEAADDLIRIAGFQGHELPWGCDRITMRPIRPQDNPTNELKPSFKDFWDYLAPEERVEVNLRISAFHRYGGVFDVTAHRVYVTEPDLIAFAKRYGLSPPPPKPSSPKPDQAHIDETKAAIAVGQSTASNPEPPSPPPASLKGKVAVLRKTLPQDPSMIPSEWARQIVDRMIALGWIAKPASKRDRNSIFSSVRRLFYP
jgi:hypothetical protein